MTGQRALGCPFCGADPTTQYWWPGAAEGSTVRRIACVNDRCHARPSVTGSNVGVATRRWNTRHVETETPTVVAAEPGARTLPLAPALFPTTGVYTMGSPLPTTVPTTDEGEE